MNRMIRLFTLAIVALVAAACATTPIEPLPLTAQEDKATSPVVRELLPQPVVPVPATVARAATPEPEVSPPPTAQAQTQASTSAADTAKAQPSPQTTGKSADGKLYPKAAKTAAGRKDGKVASATAKGSKAPTYALAAPSSSSAATATPGPAAIPPGTLYVCSATVDGKVEQTAIEFEPRVKTLCARHPEMGVCQYEREQCRLSGRRVYTLSGEEITRWTEAEYDKKVLRVRFKGD